jgi:hypothetical protein
MCISSFAATFVRNISSFRNWLGSRCTQKTVCEFIVSYFCLLVTKTGMYRHSVLKLRSFAFSKILVAIAELLQAHRRTSQRQKAHFFLLFIENGPKTYTMDKVQDINLRMQLRRKKPKVRGKKSKSTQKFASPSARNRRAPKWTRIRVGSCRFAQLVLS